VRLSKLLAVAVSLASAGAAASAQATAQSPRTFTVRATDYKFDSPSSVPAGTIQFRLENAGNEVHHLWLVQITKGHTYSEFMSAMDRWSAPKKPDWAIDVGGPNDVSAGMSASAIITLEPGQYAMVCYVPATDGRPHVMHGMFKELTVTAAGATVANEPTPDVVLKLNDYAFDLSKPIDAGSRVVRIENVATQSHEVVFGQLRAGKTLKQAVDWLNGGQKGAAPVIAVGGASGLSKGRHQFITLNLEPGRYVMLCLMPDARDGKPHIAHGMAKEFTVTAVATEY
jgi:hypothetical protein